MEVKDLKGLFIAHRGIHNDQIIENTIPAFSYAISKKIPIELDINILKDGNIVVYHDDDLKRLMGINRRLDSYCYSELEKLVFPNTNVHIPLFSDVLKLVSGKVLLVIEIKKTDIASYPKYCKKILQLLKNYTGDFVIKSFDIRIVSWFLKNTDYITGLLMIKRKNSIYDFIINQKITLSILRPDFISVDCHIIGNKLIQDFRQHHPVLVWTVKSQSILEQVKDKADSFLIDKDSLFQSIHEGNA